MSTKWTVQREFDHEPAYIMQGDREIARIPPESREFTSLIALAPEMAAALAALVAADTAICENIGLKSDQAMQRIAALDTANAILARLK